MKWVGMKSRGRRTAMIQKRKGGCFVEFHNGGYIGDWEPPLFLFAILKSGSLQGLLEEMISGL